MRIIAFLFAIAFVCGDRLFVEGQAPELIELARQSALPHLLATVKISSHTQLGTDTTALGCKLIAGLPLPDTIEVHRLEFQLGDGAYAVHISADGSLVQACDERYLNLGAGTQPVTRTAVDSDGDGLADTDDRCPQIAGIALVSSMERPGCPQATSADRDGDGSPDRLDRCPDQAGPAATEGCAILSDEDRDGVPDHSDICLAEFGVIRPHFALGCPADGSGASSQRRASADICQVIGAGIPIYDSREEEARVVNNVGAAAVIGRTAALNWYQVTGGWVKSTGDLRLTGACYNVPLVNPAGGGATGCFMRPLGEEVNVRVAPFGRQTSRLYAQEQQAVLGMSVSGDWLFYRAGWVNRAVLELAGDCERLPILNPAQVASGTIHFCPPEYSGFLPPRIRIGEAKARVASSTLANRLRAEPDYLAEQIGEIPPGSIIDAVLDGPACNGPWVWWQVEFDGQVGWTVESDINAYHYYLEPVAPSSANEGDSDKQALSEIPRPASNRLIHSANLDSLDTVSLLGLPAPQAIAWSPRGSALAAISERGEIALFSLPDFAPIPFARSLPAAASAIAFSPDGNWLAAGDSHGGVTLIALSANSNAGQAYALGKQAGPVRALAWANAGDKLAALSGAAALKLPRQAGTLKLWQFDASAPASSELLIHYHYPYPLTAAAFSRGDHWLAISGESNSAGRAAIWIYGSEYGDLAFSKALVPMRGQGFVIASPADDLGDFVYSSGDSLYQLRIDSSDDRRIYHQAGLVMTAAAFRPQVIAGAEALMALTTEAGTGRKQLIFANALNPHSPSAAFSLAPSAIAFSPDGRFLALAEPKEDRIRILGVTQH